MKIIAILAEKKTSGKDKVKAVTDMVSKIRKTYGNEDATIEPVKVNTTNGWVSLDILTDDEKAAVAEKEIRNCIAAATAETEATEGSVFDRAFEAKVATNKVLANISMTSGSAY